MRDDFTYSIRVQSAYFQYMYEPQDTLSDARNRILTTLDFVKRVGASTVDIPVSWAGVDLGDSEGRTYRGRYIWEPSLDAEQPNHLDFILTETSSRGLKANLILESTPDWVHPYLLDRTTEAYGIYDYRFWHPPRGEDELAYFGEFVAALIEHVESNYAETIGHYEIWNEPNNQTFWQPRLDEDTSPSEYVELLRTAYFAIKSRSPDAKVAFGGIALNNYGYLERYYEAALQAYPDAPADRYFFDVMSVHPYVFPEALAFRSQSPERYLYTLRRRSFTGTDALTGESFDFAGEVNGNFLGFQDVKRTMDAAEDDREKSIYLSEFGYRSPFDISDEQRALYLKQALTLASNYPYVDGMAWFTFYQDGSWDTENLDWTILSRDFEPSLTFRAYEQHTGQGPQPTISLSPNAALNGSSAVYLQPDLINLSEDDVLRWELYVDGELVLQQSDAPLVWNSEDRTAGPHRLMLVAFTRDGSVWHTRSYFFYSQ